MWDRLLDSDLVAADLRWDWYLNKLRGGILLLMRVVFVEFWRAFLCFLHLLTSFVHLVKRLGSRTSHVVDSNSVTIGKLKFLVRSHWVFSHISNWSGTDEYRNCLRRQASRRTWAGGRWSVVNQTDGDLPQKRQFFWRCFHCDQPHVSFEAAFEAFARVWKQTLSKGAAYNGAFLRHGKLEVLHYESGKKISWNGQLCPKSHQSETDNH